MNEFAVAKEYFKKLKVIEDFVDGNTKIAKMILDGTIKDIIVIKGRFKDKEDTCFGLFAIYINKLNLEILKTSNIIAEFPSLYRYKPLVSPFEFQYMIDKELKNNTYNQEKTTLFSNILKRFISGKSIEDLIVWIESNKIVEITDFFVNTIMDMLALEEPTVLVDFESVSSAKFLEKDGINIHDKQSYIDENIGIEITDDIKPILNIEDDENSESESDDNEESVNK